MINGTIDYIIDYTIEQYRRETRSADWGIVYLYDLQSKPPKNMETFTAPI